MLCLGCDDGDMTFKTFNFDQNAAPQKCGEGSLLFKIKDTEVLLLNIDPSNFKNIAKIEGAIINVSAANSLVYRNYSGTVTNAILCSGVAPANPVVTEEWIAQAGGQIKIITTESKNEEGVLTGFNHQITLVNIKFTKGDEEIIINDNLFGTYTTPLDYRFEFEDVEENTEIRKCTENDLLYKTTATESLVLDIVNDSIFNTVVDINKEIDFTNNPDNALYFNVYSGNVSNSSICSAIPPVTPVVTSRWTAVSGKLKVYTSFTDGEYRHKIYLSNVKFTRGDNTGESFTIGIPINDIADDYLIGTYITLPE